MKNSSNEKISIECIDSYSKKTFTIKMNINQLPQTFDGLTKLYLDNNEWEVISATPNHIDEIVKIKKVQLVISRIYYVDPKDICYFFPTICEELPEQIQVEDKLSDNAFRLHEDDWRQIEFISTSEQIFIDQELEKIGEIYEKHRTPNKMGFEKVHLRNKLNSPLKNDALTLRNVSNFLKIEPSHNTLGFNHKYQKKILVKNGFTYELSHCTIYGSLTNDGIVKYMGLSYQDIQKFYEIDIGLLISFCEYFQLVLINWVYAKYVANSPRF